MKPLPEIRLKPRVTVKEASVGGIELGEGVHWNPTQLPNGHIVLVGGSGSGKTQSLKSIAWELKNWLPELNIVIIDYHGDQEIKGETWYPVNMASEWGINPLIINIDPEGGGPELQAIEIGMSLQKAIQLGSNQYGRLVNLLVELYRENGILGEDITTWTKRPPSFNELEEKMRQAGDPEVTKLYLKMAPIFRYRIFSKPRFSLEEKHIRIDLSKLPPVLQRIASETIATQLSNEHRLAGESSEPRTYLFIDEAKEMRGAAILDRIIADGRKYGLNLVLASQSEAHLSLDIIRNSATKIVLPVDQTEVKKVAAKFRFTEEKLAKLTKFHAICRFGNYSKQIRITPYYERIETEEAEELTIDEIPIDDVVNSHEFKELVEFLNDD